MSSPIDNAQAAPYAALRAAVDEAYRVFGHYKHPRSPLNACTECCMPPALELEMRRLPVRRVTVRHFDEYNNAAKGPVQPAEELFYYLPRMLELMADNLPIHHSEELYLQRLGMCPPGSLNKVELKAVQRYAAAYFRCVLRGVHVGASDRELNDDPTSALVMFDIGGVDVDPLLAMWLEDEHPTATTKFVQVVYSRFDHALDYHHAFASDRPELRARLRRWLLSAPTRDRFVARLMDPHYQALASGQCGQLDVPFTAMVDAVFDVLTG